MEPARLIPRLPRPTADNIGRFSGRTWLLPQLLHWLEATTDRTFIVQGAPGAGKSMLIAWLSGAGPQPESHDARAQLEALRRRVAAAHFCVERSASVTPRGFAESVASQLTRSVASFAAALTTTLADRVTISGAVRADRIEAGATATGVYIERLELDDGHSAFDRAVRGPLQALYDGGHREPILILVDALDEGQAGSPSIGHLLAKLDDLPEPVRFLVTTRPDPRVLKHYRGITPVDLIEDAPDDENDVRRYVFERLPELEADRRDGVAARIATAAAGNFLYAHLVVEDVRRRLPAVPDPGALRLPSGLGALYHEFLNRELGADEDRWHRVFKPLLGLIAVAQGEGLSRDQLSRLVGGDVEAPLRICRQYLDGDLPKGPFRSFHKSFTDFLLWDRTNTDYHVDAAAMHTRIADDYLERFAGRWEECDDYGLRHVPDHVFVPVHLTKADTIDDARVVVLDVSFLRAKLAATDVYALVTDCTLLVSTLRSAMALSAPAVAKDKSLFASQLYGRLLSSTDEHLARLREDVARTQTTPWLRPLTPSLMQPGGPLFATLTGHTELVMDVALTPDGRSVVSASADGTVRVWDPFSGMERCTLSGHENHVLAVAVTPDGSRIVSASSDHTLRIWDLERERLLSTIDASHGFVLNARMALTPDGRRAVSASWDDRVRVWDLENGAEVWALEGHTDCVSYVAVLPDGTKALTASDDGTLRLWDIERGQPLLVLEGHEGKISAMSVGLRGDWAMSGAEDETVRFWNLSSGKEISRFDGVSASALAMLPDGQRVAVARYPTLFIVDLTRQDAAPVELAGHTEMISAIATSASLESVVVTASWDKTIRVWDLDRLPGPPTPDAHDGSVQALAALPDARHVISASSDATLRVWDVSTGATMLTLTGHEYPVTAVAVTPDGRHAISASNDMTLKMWDLESGTEMRTLRGHTDFVTGVAVTPDGTKAVSSAGKVLLLADRTLKVWDLASGAELMTLSGHQHAVHGVAVTPDGRYAVSGSNDATVRIWDLERGAQLRTLSGHRDAVYAVAVSPDGSRLLSGSADHTIKVWDLATGEEVHTLAGHAGTIASLAVMPDGQRAVSTSWDGTLKVWDLTRRQVLCTFIGDGDMTACAVMQDGHTIVAGERSGRVHFLRLECDEPPDRTVKERTC